MPRFRLLLLIGIICFACGAVYWSAFRTSPNLPDAAQQASNDAEESDDHGADSYFPADQAEKDASAPDKADGAEDARADTSAPEETASEDAAPEVPGPDPVVFEDNPRYTVERNPELGDVFRSTVIKGDRAGKILADWLEPNSYTAVLDAAKPVYSLVSIRVGHAFSIIRDPQTGEFRSFHYDVDKDQTLVVEKDGEAFKARLEEIDYTVELALVTGTISYTLSDAVAEMGEGISLAVGLADIFASEINFITELREGDNFVCLVEKRYLQKEFKGYGRIIGAWFTNQGRTHDAYLFYDDNGRSTYYNQKGENLHRALLKAPLPFLRVTSKYTMTRRHPIFGVTRPHQGIDYGAPSGTPIMAVGHGVLSKAGRAGGYGNLVVIRHNNGLESMYGHMSRFASGMRAGSKVRQGQTIGYVGATGTATGPHLDFRIKQNGKFVNPATLVVPRDKPLGSKDRKAFGATAKEVNSLRESTQDRSAFNADTWLDGGNS